MGKTDHGDNCQGENGGVKNAWGKCLWGFTDRIDRTLVVWKINEFGKVRSQYVFTI